MLLARQGLARAASSTGLSTGATPCRPTRLMRGGVLQLSRWGLLDRVVAAGHAARPAHRRSTTATTTVAVDHQARPPASMRSYAPRRTVLDPILVDAAVTPAPTFRFGITVTGLRRDRPTAEWPASPAETAAGSAFAHRRRAHRRRRRHRLDGRPAGRCAGRCARAGAPRRFVYGYWSGPRRGRLRVVLPPGRQRGLHPHQRRPGVRLRRHDPAPIPCRGRRRRPGRLRRPAGRGPA